MSPLLALLLALPASSAVLVHGHRGSRGTAPENTLAAFKEALAAGADVLELDLAVTKDDVLVVSHDPRLGSLCLGPDGKPAAGVPIRALTLEEVKAYDCGSLKNPRFPRQVPVPGERVPTLAEVFALAEGSQVHFNVETKSYPSVPEATPAPERYAELVVKEVERAGLARRVIVQSFDRRVLEAVKRIRPKLRTSMLTSDNLVDFAALAKAGGFDVISPHFEWITKEDVAALHALGVSVAPWTVNDEKGWKRMVELGVDAVITDYPAELIAYLKRRGRSYDDLLAEPKLAGSLVWEGPKGAVAYGQWSAARREDLGRTLARWEAGQGPELSAPPEPVQPSGWVPEPGAQPGFISDADAWKVYLAHAAHSLWLEKNAAAPWSLLDMSSGERALLLDSRRLFKREKHGAYRFFIGLMGNALSWDPSIAYRFLKENGLVKEDPAATVAALTSWMRKNVRHGLGEHEFRVLYGYDGPPPVDSVLHPPGGKERWRYLPGCWGVSGFYGGVLRGVNIPVEHVWNEEQGHSRPSFPTARLALAHGDDVYGSMQTPTGNVIPSRELFVAPEEARRLAAMKESDWRLESGRRAWALQRRYLADYLLYRWMSDGPERLLAEFERDAEEEERSGTKQAPYDPPIFTPEEGRRLMAAAEAELKRLGEGDLEKGKARLKERYLGFWNETTEWSDLVW